MTLSRLVFFFFEKFRLNQPIACSAKNNTKRDSGYNKYDADDGFRNIPKKKNIDLKLILGSCFFGLGWGIGGLCPGPALFLAAIGYPNALYYWWPAFAFGSYLASLFI